MKKLIRFFILLTVMCCSAAAHSQSVEETDPGFVILDVLFYRPLGFAVTIIGAGAFIVLSPLTAFASIPEPHDAFVKTAKILVLAPAAYTFIRPLGNRDLPYHVSASKHKPVATQNNFQTHNMTVAPGQHPLTPLVTDVKPPQAGKGL